MRKTRDFQLGVVDGDRDPDEDRTRLVHVVSRTAGREILFGDDEKELAGWTEDDLIDGLSVVGGEYSTKLLLGEVRLCRGNGHVRGVAEIAERVRARLYDLSAFMKELKQKMTLAYFTDGVVLGGQEFVDGFFERRCVDFGNRRKDGGRRMKGAAWGKLRALKDDVINAPS